LPNPHFLEGRIDFGYREEGAFCNVGSYLALVLSQGRMPPMLANAEQALTVLNARALVEWVV
jgi:hypothetical protein